MHAATLPSTTTSSSTRPSLQLSEDHSEPSVTCTNVYALCFNILDILTPSPGPSSIRSGFHPSHRAALTEANSPNIVKVSRQLHEVICTIQNTVEQLLQRSCSTSLLESRLASLQKTLSTTCADLHVLREAFGKGPGKLLSSLAIGLGILPVSITRLNGDLKLLSEQHAQLEAAMHLVERVRGYNLVVPSRSRRAAAGLTSDPYAQPSAQRSSYTHTPWTRSEKFKGTSQKVSQKMKVDVLTDLPASPREARRFWDTFIGDEVDEIETSEFLRAIAAWLGEELTDIMASRLRLRFDETGSGLVSWDVFREFSESGNAREMVQLYMSDPPLPLLIWVNPNVSATAQRVLSATESGVTVLQFAELSTAESWITVNRDFLLKFDDPSKVRVVTEQVLPSSTYIPPSLSPTESKTRFTRPPNTKAAQSLIACIREPRQVEPTSPSVPSQPNGLSSVADFDHGLQLPILVYTCREHLVHARYVAEKTKSGELQRVGVMATNFAIFEAYVAALAGGRNDDTRWVGYNP